MAGAKAVGIDLGTTNSAVAWVDESGRTVMLRNGEGDILTPSAVFFDDAEVIVGKEAQRMAVVYPDRVAQWVKRDMGAPVYSRPIRGERLPPEVIQACILRKLKADILTSLGPESRTVITVPAYFDERRRKATADAGEMAGLTLLDIVNEPTAAALGFGEVLGYLSPAGKVREEMVVMVYDLGGGTFDATLLRLTPGDFRTLATDGDVQLGGHDWDGRLVDHAAEEFRKIHGRDPREDPAALARLYDAVVEAKHTLSARTHTVLRVECGGQTRDVPLTREQFEEMSADLLERTAFTSRQLLKAAGLQWKDVSRVLLVGGSTRMPMVSRMLERLTGRVPDRTVNPDEAVARGAALYAHHLLSSPAAGGPGPTFDVTNVNAHSLGVEGIDPQTLRKVNVVLIPRNTPLPARRTEKFTTKTDQQRSIVIQVLEGESSVPDECAAVGRTVLRDLPPGLPKGWPVEVAFEYGTNGRLTVSAVVPGTDRSITLELEREAGLSREGISRLKQAVHSGAGFDAFEAMVDEVLGMDDGNEDNQDEDNEDGPSASRDEASGWNLSPRSAPEPRMDRATGASGSLSAAAGNKGGQAAHGTLPAQSESGPARPTSFFSRPLLDLAQPAAPEPRVEAAPHGAAIDFQPLRVERTASSSGSAGSAFRWLVHLVAYLLSAAAGLGLGYLLIRWFFPHVQLPGP